MRYFLLASLALADFLFTTLITSNRMVVTGLEKWIFGTTWCHGSAYLIRVLHISTVLHLCTISYERYDAIVRNALTYNDRVTWKRAIQNMALLWLVPAVISLGPFLGWSQYVYNPQIFACEQKSDSQTTFPFLIDSFIVPLGVIVFLNCKVLKVVRRLERSVKIIPLQPVSEDNIQEYQGQRQCLGNELGVERSQRQQQQRADRGRNMNGESENHVQVQVQLHGAMANDRSEQRGQANAAYEEEPNETEETSHHEEVVCHRGRAVSPECRSSSSSNEFNKRCWGQRPRRIKHNN